MPFYEDNTISHDITTDAGFRAWAQKVHDGLAASGLTQTSDTGQINLTTVTTPGTNSTDAGYEIWRFNDAAQSTDPIFFRVGYGRGSGAAFSRLQMTVGRSTNGSGTIGTAATARTLSQGAAISGNGRVIVSYYDGTLFILSVGTVTSSSAGSWFVIERVREADGDLLANTVVAYPHNAAGSLFTGGAWNNTPTIYQLGGSAAVSGLIWLGSLRLGDIVAAPLRGVLFSATGQIAADDTGAVTFGGVPIDYKRINMTQAPAIPEWDGTTTAHNVLCQNEA